MNTQITDATIVFFGMSVVMSILAMIIIAISVAYYKLSQNAHRDREEFLKRQEAAKMGETQIIGDARHKAQEILMSAQTQSQQFLQTSEIFSDKYKEEFRAKLLQVIAREEQEFVKLYEGLKQQNNSVIQNISKDVEISLSTQLTQFKQVMEVELKKATEEYKATAYARIQQDVSELVQTISRRVLRKSISAQEHTQLVLEALQEAKENNVI